MPGLARSPRSHETPTLSAAQQLAQLPRLRSGELQDDLAIIVCRRKS
jgi:hypothetical protein